MYLLDTNHCSRIILGNTSILHRIAIVDESQLATCAIVQGELTFMMENSERKESNRSRLSDFLDDIRVYDVNDVTATIYGQLKAALFKQFAPKEKEKRRRTNITDLGFDENDIWIAATALQYNLTVVSADSDFVRMRSVREFPLENWCN
jgi:tRNA(fMet)-specific endonuclease VapC